MSQPTIDERVATLEQQVARLLSQRPEEKHPPEKNWRSSLGMFAGDPIMKEIIDEAAKIRELDREQTRG